MRGAVGGKKSRPEYGIFEVDELAAKKVFKMLRPRVIVLTNLFRDQLDRYAEVEAAAGYLREGIALSPDSAVCLNADDVLTAEILNGMNNRRIYFGFSAEASRGEGPKYGEEGTRCPRCGAPLYFECTSYGHLGHWSCPACGISRPDADISVEEFSEYDGHNEVSFRIFGENYHAKIPLPADYNVYNAAAAVAGAAAMGCDVGKAVSALEKCSRGFGRMERFDVGGGVRMILIKNPSGCDRAINYILKIRGGFELVVCLNDLASDGCDVSWIWDADFERLCAIGDRLEGVTVSGRRAEEMFTRLEYAGIPTQKMKIIKSPRAVIKSLERSGRPAVILPTYTAMMRLRKILAKKTRRRGFWEG